MKLKSLVFTIYFFLTLNSFLHSQSDLKGVIRDKLNGNPIEFATIVVQNKSFGVYSNGSGGFTINDTKYSETDSLVISFVGYETKKIGIATFQLDSIIIFLKPLVLDLDEITVKAKKVRAYKNKKLGVNENKTNDSFSSRVSSTYEFAVLIPNDKDYSGFFKSIDIYITQFDYNEDPFRLNLYLFDAICKCPGEPLLRSSQYIKKAKKGWNSISIEDQVIELPRNGFFISYERLSLNFNPGLKAQHHSIGWIKGADAKRYRTFTRSGGDLWNIDNKFSRNNNVPLVRTEIKIF